MEGKEICQCGMYRTQSFKTYDKRIIEEVNFLMQNLNKKYGYTVQGAKEVCIYVVDNDLAGKFSENQPHHA